MGNSNGKGKPPKTPRRPHNATRSKSFGSIGELTRAAGDEPRRAIIRGKEVIMSQAERLCRMTVERAINGSVSDLKLLIQIMNDHPKIVGPARERWVLLLAGEDGDL